MSKIRLTAPDLDQKIIDKYLLSLQRGIELTKNYIPDPDQLRRFEQKYFNGNILIIAEGWCGDCSQAIPIINKFFGSTNAVKIIYRDQNPELMQRFLTNGSEAIPIVIFMDDHYTTLTHWGPRTRQGLNLFQKFRSDPKAYPRDKFLFDLHHYYDANQGFDIIDETLSLL